MQEHIISKKYIDIHDVGPIYYRGMEKPIEKSIRFYKSSLGHATLQIRGFVPIIHTEKPRNMVASVYLNSYDISVLVSALMEVRDTLDVELGKVVET